jgi:hypothetical protein
MRFQKQVESIWFSLLPPYFFKKRRILFLLKWDIEVPESLFRSLSSLRCPDDKTDLQKVGLHDLDENVRFELQRGSNRFNTYRAAPIVEYYRLEQFSISFTESMFINTLKRKGIDNNAFRDMPLRLYLRIIPNTF